ncbi:hypothetical protein BKA70DRAFT_1565636 [Coprinopsis sp. MPI-PUGE-AT-0042]|nr:hypothetical protein BKA70DRAFT_1565636 [Coprinopsis sp. MPI-PUGE-AT-0042]
MTLHNAPKLPTDLLYVVADILAHDPDIAIVRGRPVNASFCALRNLALTSPVLRHISLPYLFHKLTIHLGSHRSCAPENIDERISVFQRNLRLLDYTRHFHLMRSRHMTTPGAHLEACQRLLDFILPRIRGLEVFTAEHRYFGSNGWWYQWGQRTRVALSSCFASNPLTRVEVKGWDGELCFLTSLPASVHTLKCDQGAIEMSPGSETTFKLRPKAFQLDISRRVPPVLLTHGLTLLKQLHTLYLGRVDVYPLKSVLDLVPQTLVCLGLSYHAYGVQALRDRFLGKDLRHSFVHLPSLQELEVTIDVKDFVPQVETSDAVAELFMEHFDPAFSSIRKLVLGVIRRAENEDIVENMDDFLQSNLFQGETGQFPQLDRYLAGGACVFEDLMQVVVEVKLGEIRRPENPRGAVEPWIVKKAEEDMRATMLKTSLRHDFIIESIGEPIWRMSGA